MNRSAPVWFAVGLLLTVFVAVVVSQFASEDPDGLEYVAEQQGFDEQAEEDDLAGSPPVRSEEKLDSGGVFSSGLARLAGVVVALAIGFGVFRLIRAPRTDSPEPPS